MFLFAWLRQSLISISYRITHHSPACHFEVCIFHARVHNLHSVLRRCCCFCCRKEGSKHEIGCLGLRKVSKCPHSLNGRKITMGCPSLTGKILPTYANSVWVVLVPFIWQTIYGVECKKVVVKKLRGESEDAKRRFLKEAEMLNTIKHQNIPRFLGYSDNPHGLMMEYVAFDFTPFGLEKTVSSLDDFHHFVDSEFGFESFADVLPVCLQDVVKGLHYLHRMHIAWLQKYIWDF